jgi:hypothetical protein
MDYWRQIFTAGPILTTNSYRIIAIGREPDSDSSLSENSRRRNDVVDICRANVESTLDYLKKMHLEVVATATSGTKRRNIRLDTDSRTICYTEGNSSKRQLWSDP